MPFRLPIGSKPKSKTRRSNAPRVYRAGQGAMVPYDPTMAYTDALTMPRFPGEVYNSIQNGEATDFFASSTTASVFAANALLANSFPNFSSLAAAFDQYRVLMIELLLQPRSNFQGTATSDYGQVTTVLDYDDAVVPTSINQLMQYDNQQTVPGYVAIRRCFRPRVAAALYGGGAFTSYGNVPSTEWIDVASNTVPFYGCKLGWTSTSAACIYDLVFRAHFQFRCGR